MAILETSTLKALLECVSVCPVDGNPEQAF